MSFHTHTFFFLFKLQQAQHLWFVVGSVFFFLLRSKSNRRRSRAAVTLFTFSGAGDFSAYRNRFTYETYETARPPAHAHLCTSADDYCHYR